MPTTNSGECRVISPTVLHSLTDLRYLYYYCKSTMKCDWSKPIDPCLGQQLLQQYEARNTEYTVVPLIILEVYSCPVIDERA